MTAKHRSNWNIPFCTKRVLPEPQRCVAAGCEQCMMIGGRLSEYEPTGNIRWEAIDGGYGIVGYAAVCPECDHTIEAFCDHDDFGPVVRCPECAVDLANREKVG